jgi:Zn-dependent protease with chaperone function
MSKTLSLTLRALVALALFLGFYLLAFGLAAVLLYLPYAALVYAHRISIKLGIVCLLGAGAILKGCIFVRTPPFQAPGPEIRAEDHPALFAVVQEIADTMRTRMPRRVYLIPDVNAFVAEVGGFFGIGATRVMGIGVGLLAVDNVSELKATIAHELGHYAGGDTLLGGFVYRTRAAIGRVLEAVSGSLLSKPFELYAKLFLRVSHGVGRHQELAADAAGVSVAGREAHVSGLEREARAAVLLQLFLRGEVSPLLDAGFCPSDLFGGFRRFVAETERRGVHAEIGAALADAKTDPYDTHPALAERIAFARELPDPGLPLDGRPARSLLSRPERAEDEAATFFLGRIGVKSGLTRLAWDDLAAKFYAPKMAEDARRASERLYPVIGDGDGYAAMTRALLGALGTRDVLKLARVIEPELEKAPSEVEAQVAGPIVRSALAAIFGAALVDCGGRWVTGVGMPLSVELDGESVEPSKLAEAALEGAAGRAAMEAKLVAGAGRRDRSSAHVS